MLRLLLLLLPLCVMGCATQPPPKPDHLVLITPVATLDENDPVALCSAVETHWSTDWEIVIRALTMLETLEVSCTDSLPIQQQLYGAYIGYGTWLEQHGRQRDAIGMYQTALDYNFAGQEALHRLQHLRVPVSQTAPVCDADIINRVIPLIPDYIPTSGEFVYVEHNRFMLSGEAYPVFGVNYYPRDYPEQRFLTQMNVESSVFELDLMHASGLNTLRIYIRHTDLFICPGNGAIPIPANLQRLDQLIHAASERGYKLILVLNHDADLTLFPLYTSPPHTMQQIAFLANRYKNEPAVMAYDIRESGDVDYAASAAFTREEVLEWLAQTIRLVREEAPNQLVTAGWTEDSSATAPLVDFVSFQNFADVEKLRQEIAILTSTTSKPILLAAIGYNTFEMDELGQRQAFQRALEAAQRNNLAGWVITTAFDYPLTVMCITPGCSAEDGPANRFGIWNNSYFPKRAVEAVEMAAGISSTAN